MTPVHVLTSNREPRSTTNPVIEGGAHDLALSPKSAREKYLTTVLDWLDATV
jgi:alpha-beta hydrolase superfamily lysophospholipase